MGSDVDLVEIAARAFARHDRLDPDAIIAYERFTDGTIVRRDQPPPWRSGKVWPEMPLWQFYYAAPATELIAAIRPHLIAEGMEAAAKIVEGGYFVESGYFLRVEAPTARFAREASAAIRREMPSVNPPARAREGE